MRSSLLQTLEPRRLLADFAPDPAWHGDGARDGFYSYFMDFEFDAQGRLYVLHDDLDGFQLQRLRSNGALDPTFGDGGQVLIDGNGPYSSIDVADDGSVAVAPQKFGDDPQRVLLIDRDGRVLFNKPLRVGDNALIIGVTVTADGGVIASTRSIVDDVPVKELYKFKRDGSFDTTFGKSGRRRLSDAVFEGLFVDWAVTDPKGRMVLVLRDGYSTRNIIARFADNGSLDSTFGNGAGYIESPVRWTWSSRDESSNPIGIAADGKIYLHDAGYEGSRGTPVRIVRLNADGSPDASFGKAGFVTNPGGLNPSTGKASVAHVALSPDGSSVYFTSYGIIKRLDATGALDPTFHIRTRQVDPNGDLQRIVIDPSGRIYGRGYVDYREPSGLVRLAALKPVYLASSGELRIIGGDASDRIYLKTHGRVTTLSFNDQLHTFATSAIASIRVIAFGGNDRIELATGRPALIDGGMGNNRIVGTDGRDTIIAGRGDDVIFGRAGDDEVDAGRGNNRIAVGDGSCLITTGSTGNNRIETGSGSKSIFTGDGDDTISSTGGRVYLESGGGDDHIHLGGRRRARVNAGAGDDYVLAGNGDDRIVGGEGNDTLLGMDGVDILYGGPGDDTITSGPQADSLTGGPGSDVFTRNFDYDMADDETWIDIIADFTQGEDSYSTGPF